MVELDVGFLEVRPEDCDDQVDTANFPLFVVVDISGEDVLFDKHLIHIRQCLQILFSINSTEEPKHEVLGVFSTIEDAKDFCETLCKIRKESKATKPFAIYEGEISFKRNFVGGYFRLGSNVLLSTH